MKNTRQHGPKLWKIRMPQGVRAAQEAINNYNNPIGSARDLGLFAFPDSTDFLHIVILPIGFLN